MSALPAFTDPLSTAVRQEQYLSVLEPMAKLGLHVGLSPREVLTLMRDALLSGVAASDRRAVERPRTQARDSMESGLTRSEVEQTYSLREQRRATVLADLKVRRAADRVITAWQSHPFTSGPYGTSSTLPIRASAHSAGPHRVSLEELVHDADASVSVEQVLTVLLSTGSVTFADPSESVIALSPDFANILDQGDDATFRYVTSTLAGVARTITTNAYRLYPIPRMFERRAIAEHVVDATEFEALSDKLVEPMSDSLVSLTARLNASIGTSIASEGAVQSGRAVRASIGIYLMAEEAAADDASLQPKRRTSVPEPVTIDVYAPNPASSAASSVEKTSDD